MEKMNIAAFRLLRLSAGGIYPSALICPVRIAKSEPLHMRGICQSPASISKKICALIFMGQA
ncbi:hypothetical protein QUF80_05715 [Desulfococcaceae bacterium HSG8]|nr:hypothetical protein [Desulfococcaceae bacterium HSG8]